ncbi:MAG: cofactor-independent phosphoglycerate mutase [Hespellia sp.]|nr:cofactor-independent phosphoglycerate mutase [Hespellia sp.]
MKYIVVLSDGMADEPLEELGNRTPLEAARTPHMDALAKVSEIGLAQSVPAGMNPGSDTANLSVIGYNPKIYYSGRSPLEALSIGVDMEESDVSFRCNIVTLSEEDGAYEDRTIIDHSSDEISTEDAAVLVEALKEGLKREGYEFYVGTSYRHLLIQKNGKIVELTPPHDILTKRIGAYLPADPVLRQMQEKSYDILENHPVNVERRKQGLHPANSAWFWGAGTRPMLTSFEEKTGKKGAMISAVDLLKGIAVGADMHNISVEGANGGLHTNYEGKAKAAVDALLKDNFDFVYIHIEAPDEMGHQGSCERKIQAIESIDEKVVGYIQKAMAGEDYRMMILPDHPTPIAKRTHTSDPIPYLLYDSTKEISGCDNYSEKTAKENGIFCEEGYTLMYHLLED